MRSKPFWIGIAMLCCAAALVAGKKKNADDVTQTLALPKDPPAVASGETRRLIFSVSSLSGKGLLTQQTRDALKAVMKDTGGAPMIHIRAFVAGGGDIRRVPQIVSEVLTDKKQPLPSVSVLRAGALSVDNAQVVLEVVSAGRKETNPGDLRFVAGEESIAANPAGSAKPLLSKALDSLAEKLGASPALAVTCYVSQMAGDLSAAISQRFPGAAIDLVQPQRLPWQAAAQCEAVARGAAKPSAKLAFTGTRVAFGTQEKDAALAFQYLDKDLSEAGADDSGLLLTNVYSLSESAAKRVRSIRGSRAPMQILILEGLGALDGSFAADAVAAVNH
ncbi:MAG: hypothetical protein KGN84_01075 [Acidobacteriota bacterium]|nr:hypothetical protein [Acidobacteriota bacterium]